MPNRIIKESIRISNTLANLSDFQENFFYRLIVTVDDYGRYDARPPILKASLYPLRERLTLRDIEGALKALVDAGCVEVYRVDDRPYLHLPTWEVHQRIRNKRSKYPEPACDNLPTLDSNPPPNAPVIQSESRIQNPESNPNDSAEPQADSTPPLISLPLNDGQEYPVLQGQVSEWGSLYPAVDVLQQLREMRGWLLSNKEKRKTKRGVQAFITRWLGREQDKGGVCKSAPPTNGNVFLDMLEEHHEP